MKTVLGAANRLALTLVATTACLIIGASAASASTPASWPDPEPTTHLRELFLYGGSLAGLLVFLILFSLVVHRNNYVPPPPSDEVEKAPGNKPVTH